MIIMILLLLRWRSNFQRETQFCSLSSRWQCAPTLAPSAPLLSCFAWRRDSGACARVRPLLIGSGWYAAILCTLSTHRTLDTNPWFNPRLCLGVLAALGTKSTRAVTRGRQFKPGRQNCGTFPADQSEGRLQIFKWGVITVTSAAAAAVALLSSRSTTNNSHNFADNLSLRTRLDRHFRVRFG